MKSRSRGDKARTFGINLVELMCLLKATRKKEKKNELVSHPRVGISFPRRSITSALGSPRFIAVLKSRG